MKNGYYEVGRLILADSRQTLTTDHEKLIPVPVHSGTTPAIGGPELRDHRFAILILLHSDAMRCQRNGCEKDWLLGGDLLKPA